MIKIRQFTNLITGGTPSTKIKDYWESGNIPWLNSGELNKKIIYSANNYITKKGLDNSVAKIMPPGTVLIALTGTTTGLTALLKIEACANQSVTGILPSNKHIPEYLYYYLTSIREKILSRSWGGAQKHINQNYVKEIEVPLPSLSEQKRIADTLDKVDIIIQQRKQSIKLLDDYIKSVFYDMFGDLEVNNKSFNKEKLINLINIDCKSIKAGDIENDTIYIDLESIEKQTGKILRYNKVKKGQIKSNKFVFTSDHILYGKLRPYLNKVALPTSNGVCSTDIFPILPKSSITDKHFISYILRQNYFVNYTTERSQGANLPRVSSNIIYDFNFISPPLEMQKKFATVIKNMDKLKSQMEASLKETENLFSSLMQKYFKSNDLL